MPLAGLSVAAGSPLLVALALQGFLTALAPPLPPAFPLKPRLAHLSRTLPGGIALGLLGALGALIGCIFGVASGFQVALALTMPWAALCCLLWLGDATPGGQTSREQLRFGAAFAPAMAVFVCGLFGVAWLAPVVVLSLGGVALAFSPSRVAGEQSDSFLLNFRIISSPTPLKLGGMKKVVMLTLFGLSCAHAQTWKVDGPFQDEFMGCARIASGQVQCAMKSSYIGAGATYFGATYFAKDSAVYAPDRKRYLGSSSSINGKDVSTTPVNVSKSAPVTVLYIFDYPREFNTISLVFLDTGMIKDVPIKGEAAAAPAPSPKPAPPAPAPAAPTAPATITLSAFDIKLTNCTASAGGGFTCTKAELIPKP